MKLTFLVITLSLALPIFARASTEGCPGSMDFSSVPVHKIEFTLSGKPVSHVRLTDVTGGQSKVIFEIEVEHSKTPRPLMQIKRMRLGYIDRVISNSEVAPDELVSFDRMREVGQQLTSSQEFTSNLGWPSSVNVTSGHRSLLTHNTIGGTPYRNGTGPIRLVVLDKNTLQVKRIFDYKMNAAANKTEIADIHRIIEEYASSFEDPAPTPEALASHNTQLLEEIKKANLILKEKSTPK
jgi:hypothetical protein